MLPGIVCFKLTDGFGAPIGAGDGTYYTDSKGEPGDGDPDLAVLVGLEDALAGQVAVVRVHIAAIVNMKDGKNTTLTVENKAFSGILIHKTDSVTGKGIYGVTFLLYDSTNKPIGQYASAVRTDGVHQIARLVPDLKHSALQQRPGGQAVGGVVVGGFFGDLDLCT